MTSIKRGLNADESRDIHHNQHHHHNHEPINNEGSELPVIKNLDDVVYQPPPYEPRTHDPPHEPQTQAVRDEKFQNIVNKYEIRQEYADILQQLQGFKITFIFDDSGSMNSVLNE